MELKFFPGDFARVKDECGPCKSVDGAVGQIVEFDGPFSKLKTKDDCIWIRTDALQYALREFIAINWQKEMTEWDTLEEAFKAVTVHGGTILRFANLDWPSQKVWTFHIVSPQYWHMCGEQEKPSNRE